MKSVFVCKYKTTSILFDKSYMAMDLSRYYWKTLQTFNVIPSFYLLEYIVDRWQNPAFSFLRYKI